MATRCRLRSGRVASLMLEDGMDSYLNAGQHGRSGVAVLGLAQGYRSRLVIEDLDFAAGPGVVWLLGPNGAGKISCGHWRRSRLRAEGR